jgi:hypothetical protein
MGSMKRLGGVLLTVLLTGCAGPLNGPSNTEMASEPTGGAEAVGRGLQCQDSEQRAVDLDIEGPGRSSPERAVAPFADGSTVVANENKRVATVHVLGADGNPVRVFKVSKHRDGWWPDGFTQCAD